MVVPITITKPPSMARQFSRPIRFTPGPGLMSHAESETLVAGIKAEVSQKRLHWLVMIFLWGLVVPWIIPVGTMNLSVYRILLLFALGPCLWIWLSGSLGRIRMPDLCLLLFCFWGATSLIYVHGLANAVQPAGMLFIETMGAYLLGRCFIRSVEQFRAMAKLVVRIIAVLLPFALWEWWTGEKPLLNLFGYGFETPEALFDTRHGFGRVQGPFSHSIEFGVFCASIFAIALLTKNSHKLPAIWHIGLLIAGCAFMSMSSAAAGVLVFQISLLAWNRLLGVVRARWILLIAIVVAAYLVVEFGSDQTPVQFYISRFTFDAQTGWWRLLIWEFGSASVLNHPLFGIGLGEWARPPWMLSASVDNFWLINAMRYGLPAFLLLLSASVWMLVAIAFTPGWNEDLRLYRHHYLISLTAFLLIGCTVHFWASIYAWFAFLLGAGAWLLDRSQEDTRRATATSKKVTTRSYGEVCHA